MFRVIVRKKDNEMYLQLHSQFIVLTIPRHYFLTLSLTMPSTSSALSVGGSITSATGPNPTFVAFLLSIVCFWLLIQAVWANGSALLLPGSWQCWLWTGQTCPNDLALHRLYQSIACWSLEWTLPFCAVILRRCWSTIFHNKTHQHHQSLQQSLQQLQYYEQILHQTHTQNQKNTSSKQPQQQQSSSSIAIEAYYDEDASVHFHAIVIMLILLILHAGGLLASPTSWYFSRGETHGALFGSFLSGRIWSWIVLGAFFTFLSQCIFSVDMPHEQHTNTRHNPLPRRIQGTSIHPIAATTNTTPGVPVTTRDGTDSASVTSSITGTLHTTKTNPHETTDSNDDDDDDDNEIEEQSNPNLLNSFRRSTGTAALVDEWFEWGKNSFTNNNNSPQSASSSSSSLQYLKRHWISFPSTHGMMLLLLCITIVALGTASPQQFTHQLPTTATIIQQPDSFSRIPAVPTGNVSSSPVMNHTNSAHIRANRTTTTDKTPKRFPITPRFVQTWTWLLLQQVQMLITQIYVIAKGTETDRVIYYSVLAILWFAADLVHSIVTHGWGVWWILNAVCSLAFTTIMGTLTLHAILETVLAQYHREYEEEAAPLWIPPPVWKYLQRTRNIVLHVGIVGPKMMHAIATALSQQVHAVLEQHAPKMVQQLNEYQKVVMEHVKAWTPIVAKVMQQLVDAGTEVIQTYLPQLWKAMQDLVQSLRKGIQEGEWDRPGRVWERIQKAAMRIQGWLQKQYEQFAAEAREQQKQQSRAPRPEDEGSLAKPKYVGDVASVSMQSKKSQ